MKVDKKDKKKNKLRIIPIILCVILLISIFVVILYAYNKQYNLKGISNILNFSRFLKNRLQTKESNEFKEKEISPRKKSKSKSKKNSFQ